MARKRDYKAEYERRLANAAKRGLSRSQARGHARDGEAPVRQRPVKDIERLEAALKTMRETGSQAAAAKAHKLAPERLRQFIRENALAERRGRAWHFTDLRPREMQVFSKGELRQVKLAGFDQASLNGRHLAAVRKLLDTNDPQFLLSFEGQAVVDHRGKMHLLETDPNALYRLTLSDDEPFHEIYRLIH